MEGDSEEDADESTEVGEESVAVKYQVVFKDGLVCEEKGEKTKYYGCSKEVL